MRLRDDRETDNQGDEDGDKDRDEDGADGDIEMGWDTERNHFVRRRQSWKKRVF